MMVHSLALKVGALAHLPTSTFLLTISSRAGDFSSSKALFGEIYAKDVVIWNAMITAAIDNQYLIDAISFFNEMVKEGNGSDSATLVIVISALSKMKTLTQCRALHGLSVKSGLLSGSFLCNALIDMHAKCGCTQNGFFLEALEAFNFMRRKSHITPDSIALMNVVSACGNLELGWEGKVLLHGLAFKTLVDKDTQKSVAAWNSMISAYGFHSNGLKAVEFFNEMIDSGSNPMKTTFINLLSACSHSGLVKEGLWCYEHMSDKYGVQPVTEHHVCIVDMLGRSGKLNEAYEFIKQIPSQPEAGLWGALLSACNYHGDIEMGREVANVLFSLEPENVAYYVLLCNMYIAAGRWSDAVGLRSIIQDKRLKEPAGWWYTANGIYKVKSGYKMKGTLHVGNDKDNRRMEIINKLITGKEELSPYRNELMAL
ncbi:hypothetical protein RJ639_016140 [Escallonia herrerae]|uniref:Pentatricopeptide repeat-containing protein n=1 Tax=Escallonia herrerae TaxID=1293975 RepID=A0AA88VGW5_9ASTE|nr:hypothetical protein RJ639_016140 [Escallonia herrerae]